MSLATWIVTIGLVGIASLTGLHALFILGYNVSQNLTDAQGSVWGAFVCAIAGLLIPTAGLSAYCIARRYGFRGRPMAWLVASVIFGTVNALYMLYLALFIVLA